MHIQDVLYYVFWAGLFIVMMRFGLRRPTRVPKCSGGPNAPGFDIPRPVPGGVTDQSRL